MPIIRNIKSSYPVGVLYSLLFASSSGRSNVISASYRCVGFHCETESKLLFIQIFPHF